jgi:hypothetical protein
VHVVAETVSRKAALLVFEVVGQAQGAEEVERVQVVVLASGPPGMMLYHCGEIGLMWTLALATSYSKLLAPRH